MRYNFKEQFKHLSNADINRTAIGKQQRALLHDWLGTGIEGARAAKGTLPPDELDSETLRAYHEIARRVIEAGRDFQGTQHERLNLIEGVLDDEV